MSSNQPRSPLVQARKEWPFSANTAVVNLLTTTLSVVAAAPFLVNQFQAPQHPAHQLYLNDDTSAGTPKTLTADKQLPFQNYQHTAPDRVRAVTDTTQDTPKTLTGDKQLPVQNYQHTAPDRPRPVTDTTQDSVQLYAVLPPAPPFYNVPGYQLDRVRPVTDTTRGTPKTLAADAQLPVFNYQHTPPDKVRPVTDTTHGTPKTLYADAQLPVFNYQHTAPDRIRPVTDTSQRSQGLLIPIQPLPPGQSTPQSFQNSQYYQKAVINTTAGTPIELLPIPVVVVVAPVLGPPPVISPFDIRSGIATGQVTDRNAASNTGNALPSQKAVNPLKPNYPWIQWINSLYLAVRNFSFAGNKDASSAATGNVGEVVTATVASAGAITLASATPANVTTISLTAGDWELTAQVDFALTGVTATLWQAGVGLVAGVLPPQPGGAGLGTDPAVALPLATTALSSTLGLLTKATRLNVAATVTVYLVAQADFSAGAVAAYGTVSARRMR